MRRPRRLIATALALGASVVLVALIFWFVDRAIRPGVLAPVAFKQRVDPFCNAGPSAGFDRAPNLAYVGALVNARYGYAITIPAGLTAYAGPGVLRGFTILLSRQPRAVLRVDAVYDTFFDITAVNVHLRDVSSVRLHDRLLSNAGVPWSLEDTPGGRYRMQVRCPGNSEVYIHDDVIVLRNREIYRVDLQSVPARYGADARVMEQMLRSWKWVPIPQ